MFPQAHNADLQNAVGAEFLDILRIDSCRAVPRLPTASVAPTHVKTASYGTQRTLNGEVHNWYRIILGFPDHLVGMLIDKLNLKEGDFVLDPFCGTSTTLVECMKRNLPCVGIEANPACVFASKVKTNWELKPNRLLECLDELLISYNKELRRTVSYKNDPAYEYLSQTGMLDRGWISAEPLRKAICIKNAISAVRTSASYKNALRLALISELVQGASNVKFGPQLYCGKAKKDAEVFAGFQLRVCQIAKDLETVSAIEHSTAEIFCGDSRDCKEILSETANRTFKAIICSPPYPTEHDYTRHTRLELAFLGLVWDVESVRRIKHAMVCSHTKGIYKTDHDGDLVKDNPLISPLVKEIESRARDKTYGFARLYGRVTLEYFGGMKRHLQSAYQLMSTGGKCAYVVGDQTSYLQVHIPTAEILATIAAEVGFVVTGIERWRGRWSTATSRIVDENILMLERK